MPATTASRVVALRAPGGAEISRSEIDAYTAEFVKIYAPGAWLRLRSTTSPRGQRLVRPVKSHCR
jgi:aspartyl-tRNA synthetase